VRRHGMLYAMIAPAILGFLLFKYIPAIGAVTIPFTRYSIVDGFFGSEWVGLKWFLSFLNGAFFPRLLRNTVLLGLLGMVIGFPMPILLALSLNEIRSQPFKRFAQTITYLPHFISVVVVVGLMYSWFAYDGYVNNFLGLFRIDPIDFQGDPRWFRPLYIGSGIWQGIGWSSIIYLAALSSIDPGLYESASIDGANRWQKALRITLPSLIPVMTILFLIQIGNILDESFAQIFNLYNPLVYPVADVFETYIYRSGIEEAKFDYSAAVGLFKNVAGVIILVAANSIIKRFSEYAIW
jgi:putative aldouronate transport system permease protein